MNCYLQSVKCIMINFKKDADFTIVGYVTDASEGNNFIAKDGTSHPLTAQGWDALKK